MRLGIHLPQFREPVPGAVLAEAAQAAESAGLDDVWVSDHVVLPPGSRRPPESFHDALTVLTWAAAATRTVGLGTSVLVAPYRHPVLLAKSLASLDALSGGRVICGIAAGWMESEFAALGVPFAERGARTDAAIAVMQGLWRGEDAFAWGGVAIENVSLLPRPSRPAGPPVWVGGDSDAGIRRAVRVGDGWHTTVSDPTALDGRLGVLDAALAAADRSRAGFTISVRARATPAQVAELAPLLADRGVDHLLVDPPPGDPANFQAFATAIRAHVRPES